MSTIINVIKKIYCRLIYYQKICIFRWNKYGSNNYKRDSSEIKISHATIKDIEKLYIDSEMDLKDYDWNTLKEKCMNGIWKAIKAESEGKIVGYVFYSTHEMSFAGSKALEFSLPKGSAYLFRSFVHPNARNKGIGKTLEYFRLDCVWKEGCNSAYGAVNSTNRVSINNCKILGGEIIGAVHFIKTEYFNVAFRSVCLCLENIRCK